MKSHLALVPIFQILNAKKPKKPIKKPGGSNPRKTKKTKKIFQKTKSPIEQENQRKKPMPNLSFYTSVCFFGVGTPPPPQFHF
jgi:hypothetical protein